VPLEQFCRQEPAIDLMCACMLHKGSASETVLPAGARDGFNGGVSHWSLVSGCGGCI